MKICYIFSGIYQAKIIGQSAVAMRLVDHINKKENRVYIISNYLLESEYFYLNGDNNLLLKGPNTFKTYLKNTRKILKYLKEVEPDILHVRGLLMVIYIWILNKLFLHYPLVVSIFETPEHLNIIYIKLISFCINRAEITFVSSGFIRDKFIKEGAIPEKILVRHTGLKERFLKVPDKNFPADTDVVFFGDSTRERGFDLIFRLAKMLKNIKFKVLIRWQGENCRKEFDQVRKFKNVIIWHYPYSESLEKILLKTKLIVLPYRYMGMRPPISLLESMALGKCVITSDMEGNNELIRHGENGFIYNFSDLDEVSEKIKYLLSHDAERNNIGQDAEKTIRDKYSIEEYDKIYNYYIYIKDNFYEKRMFNSVGGKHVSLKEVNFAMKMLNPQNTDNILDVGTGSGRLARAIVQNSMASVVGVDPDKKILKEGEALKTIFLSKDEGKRYKCVFGDGHNLPFEDNKFDKVFSFRALKYYKDPWRGIDEMVRVLKPGGELVLEITSNRSWESFVNPIIMKLSRNRKIIHFWERNMRDFNPPEVKKYLQSKNMRLLAEKPLHKIPPRIYTTFNNQLFNQLFNSIDKIFFIVTPIYFFSKSVVLKCKKI